MISKNISALPGNPSTFWSNNDGQTWHRTQKDALEGINAVDPEEFVMKKSFWAQNKKTIIIALIVVVAAAGAFYAYKKGFIRFK